jgi:hypothetical protein
MKPKAAEAAKDYLSAEQKSTLMIGGYVVEERYDWKEGEFSGSHGAFDLCPRFGIENI